MDFFSEHVIQPYGIRLILATPTHEEHYQSLKEKWKMDSDEENLCGVYRLNHEGWATFLVVFKINYLQTLTYGMIAHEALHIVDYTLGTIGQEHDPENNEVGCYLIEWLTNMIFKHFIDRKLLKELSAESKIIKKDGEID